MNLVKKFLLALFAIFLAVIITTYVALEISDVAIATTHAPSGEHRTTHIWYIRADANVILEAGNPQNPWVQDLRAGSTLHLEIDGLQHLYTFEFETESHERIRSEMRQKYGWRDNWIGLLFDVSQSQRIVAHKIDP